MTDCSLQQGYIHVYIYILFVYVFTLTLTNSNTHTCIYVGRWYSRGVEVSVGEEYD